MSINQMAQVFTEILNDSEFRKLAAADSEKAFNGWDLTQKERALLVEDAKSATPKVKPSESKALHYLIANEPLTEPVGTALGNAVGRHLGLPVIGPRAGGCDGGCCSWHGRIIFGRDER